MSRLRSAFTCHTRPICSPSAENTVQPKRISSQETGSSTREGSRRSEKHCWRKRALAPGLDAIPGGALPRRDDLRQVAVDEMQADT
jgi:hypothetical protein